MSNLEKYKGFFETDLSCLSAEQIDKYVQKRLNKKDKYQFEKHLLDCEFCNEAVEGVFTFEKAINLSEISQQLNSEITAKYLSKKNKIVPLFSYLKIAASVIILFTAGWFVFDASFENNQNMAFSENKQVFEGAATSEDEESESETSLSQDAIPILAKEKQEEKKRKDKISATLEEEKSKNQQTKKARNLSTPPSIPKEIKENTSTNLETEMVEDKGDNEKGVLADFVAEKMESVSDDEDLGFVSQNSSDPLIQGGKTQTIVSSQDGSGLKNQKRKREQISKPSLKKLKKEVKKKPSDLDLGYQYALAYFDNKQWKKSSEQFSKILSDTSQAHYYDAIWYSALIDIEEQKLKLAKEKLDKLVKNEVYAERAKVKLKEIE